MVTDWKWYYWNEKKSHKLNPTQGGWEKRQIIIRFQGNVDNRSKINSQSSVYECNLLKVLTMRNIMVRNTLNQTQYRKLWLISWDKLNPFLFYSQIPNTYKNVRYWQDLKYREAIDLCKSQDATLSEAIRNTRVLPSYWWIYCIVLLIESII